MAKRHHKFSIPGSVYRSVRSLPVDGSFPVSVPDIQNGEFVAEVSIEVGRQNTLIPIRHHGSRLYKPYRVSKPPGVAVRDQVRSALQNIPPHQWSSYCSNEIAVADGILWEPCAPHWWLAVHFESGRSTYDLSFGIRTWGPLPVIGKPSNQSLCACFRLDRVDLADEVVKRAFPGRMPDGTGICNVLRQDLLGDVCLRDSVDSLLPTLQHLLHLSLRDVPHGVVESWLELRHLQSSDPASYPEAHRIACAIRDKLGPAGLNETSNVGRLRIAATFLAERLAVELDSDRQAGDGILMDAA